MKKSELKPGTFLLYVPFGAVFEIVFVDFETKTFRAKTNGTDVSQTIYYFDEICPSKFLPVTLYVLPIED